MNEKEELTIVHGDNIWKAHLEHHNEFTFMHGFPYYRVTLYEEIYYLWRLDWDDPSPTSYHIMKQSDGSRDLCDEGRVLENVLGKIYEENDLYNLGGKELIKKLREHKKDE